MKDTRAFILRITPSGVDKVSVALQADQLIIGWAEASGLLDLSLEWNAFRGIIRNRYYSKEESMRKAGSAAGHMWRFIRDMTAGDLVVVPYGTSFYVAEVVGSATYDAKKKADDTAYRRAVKWLNDKKPLSRQIARAALLSRMKVQGTTADATDLVEEIRECLVVAARSAVPTFQRDLKARLIREVLDEMRSGRIESFGFERLLQSVLLGLGALECRIVPRKEDKGADLVASFRVAGAIQVNVAVQAKHWQPTPPVDGNVVKQLITGIEAEEADLGMVVTSGSISEDAARVAQEYFDETGVRIELVDGEQLAKLIVENGIDAT